MLYLFVYGLKPYHIVTESTFTHCEELNKI